MPQNDLPLTAVQHGCDMIVLVIDNGVLDGIL